MVGNFSWKSVRLGDYCTKIGSGATPRGGKESYQTSGISLIRSQNVHNGGFSEDGLAYIDEEQARRLENVTVSAGDVLLNITGDSVARVCQVPNHILPARVNQHVAIIRPDNEKIDAGFLRYYLVSPAKQSSMLSIASGGATRNAITKSMIEDFEIPCPSIEVQRAIASNLRVIDDLIENNTKRIKILEEATQLICREWFVHYRFPEHEKAEMVDSGTELGKVPEGWRAVPLREVIEYYIGGGWGEAEAKTEFTKPAFVIRGTDIPRVKIGDTTDCPLRYHKPSNLESRRLRHADIIFEVSGGSKGQPVGRSTFIPAELLKQFEGDCICASFCKLIRPKSAVCSAYQLSLALEEHYVDGVIEKYQVQSTGITNFQFEAFIDNVKIVLPTEDVRKQFEDVIRPIFGLRQILGNSNQKLRNSRDLLLPRLISGQLAVA